MSYGDVGRAIFGGPCYREAKNERSENLLLAPGIAKKKCIWYILPQREMNFKF